MPPPTDPTATTRRRDDDNASFLYAVYSGRYRARVNRHGGGDLRRQDACCRNSRECQYSAHQSTSIGHRFAHRPQPRIPYTAGWRRVAPSKCILADRSNADCPDLCAARGSCAHALLATIRPYRSTADPGPARDRADAIRPHTRHAGGRERHVRRGSPTRRPTTPGRRNGAGLDPNCFSSSTVRIMLGTMRKRSAWRK